MIENKLCEVQAELASGRHEVTRRGAVNKGLEQELPGREHLFAQSHPNAQAREWLSPTWGSSQPLCLVSGQNIPLAMGCESV